MSESAQAASTEASAPAPVANETPSTPAATNSPTDGKAAAPAPAATKPDDDTEEVKIGSVTGRVPKALAQTIKALERGFQSKAQEAAAARNFFQLAQQAKDNPQVADMLFEKLGINADQYSQARLQKRLERELMSPEQRKLAELEAYKTQKDKEDQERQQKEQQDKQSAEERVADQGLRNEIFAAWKDSGLPPHPEFGAWIAAEMQRAHAQRVDLSAKDAAATVKEKFVTLSKMISSSLGPEQLEDHVGKDALSKWREFDVKRVTSQQVPKPSSADSRPGATPASTNGSGKKRMLSEKEYREYFENLQKKHG